MSVGNLFDLGSKPYQDIVCNSLTTDSINTDDLNIDSVRVNTIEPNDTLHFNIVGGIELTDPLTIDNTQTSVLVRNSITNRIESRIFEKYSPTLHYYSQANGIFEDNDPTFKIRLLLTFTPEVSGPYKISFTSLFGNVGILDRGQLAFRYNNGFIDDTIMDSYNSSILNENSVFGNFILFSLTAGVQQTYQIETRATSGFVRIQQSRILVEYVGVNL